MAGPFRRYVRIAKKSRTGHIYEMLPATFGDDYADTCLFRHNCGASQNRHDACRKFGTRVLLQRRFAV